MTLASQGSPTKGNQPQKYVSATEKPPGNQTGSEPVPFLSCSNNCPSDIQEPEKHTTTTPTGDATIALLTITTLLIEEGLVTDEQTNEFCLPLTSMVVLKRKQEMPYESLHFENNITVNALEDSGAYVSAMGRKDWDTIKKESQNIILEIDESPNFQIQVANGQLEKPLATTTLKFEIGDNTFAEHFVVMRKLTGPICGLLFMRKNSVVIDTIHGLIIFPILGIQVETA